MKYSRFHCTKSINIDESSVFAQIYENQNCSICVSIYQSIRDGRVTTGLLRLQRSTRLCDNGCVSPSSIHWQELLRNHIRCVGRWRPGSLSFVIIWASTRETLELLLVNNKGADQPAHPRSLINAFVICYLKSKYLLILPFVVFNMIMSLAPGALAHVRPICLTSLPTGVQTLSIFQYFNNPREKYVHMNSCADPEGPSPPPP